MASIRRKPGTRFWYACYTDNSDVQRQRSTKTTNRADALRIAEAFEEAYRRRQTESQVRRVMASIFEDIHGTPLNDVTVSQYAEQWLVRITPEVDPATLDRYGDAFKSARRADASIFSKRIDNVTTSDLAALRAGMLKNHSFGTTRTNLKPISRMFKTAFHDGLIKDNPAARLGRIKKPTDESAVSKQPFTIAQIKAILTLANDEWKGMILAGYYTAGQRLGDIASLTPGKIDLREEVVSFRSGKTGRTVNLPILPGWLADLRTRVHGKKKDEPLFPKAASMLNAQTGKVSRLSNAFRTLLSRAGLATPPGHGKAAIAGRRTASALSFHSFRYTATSVMKNSGVSDSVVMDIVGHESEAVSENYTKVSHQAKRAALRKLPDIT